MRLMSLVCEKCNCEMIAMYGNFSTRPIYWECPSCKYKVKSRL